MTAPDGFTLVFYEEDGREPVLEWARQLVPYKRRAVAGGFENVLARQGIGVCRTGWGRWVKGTKGIFELRIRHDYPTILRNAGLPVPCDLADKHNDVLLRVFCHAYGNKIILLLAAYDKGQNTNSRRQTQEIKRAEQRLKRWKRNNTGYIMGNSP